VNTARRHDTGRCPSPRRCVRGRTSTGDLQTPDTGYSSGGIPGRLERDRRCPGSAAAVAVPHTSWCSWDGSNLEHWCSSARRTRRRSPSPNPPDITWTRHRWCARAVLYVDGSGNYQVFVPACEPTTAGRPGAAARAGGPRADHKFYIAKPGDTADTFNGALAAGQNCCFTPGVYHLGSAIQVTRPTRSCSASVWPPSPGQRHRGDDGRRRERREGRRAAVRRRTDSSQTAAGGGPSGSGTDHSGDRRRCRRVFFASAAPVAR